MSAPERIWLSCIDAENEAAVWFDPDEGGTEYVRADLPPTLSACIAHPEVKALVGLMHQAVTTRAADDMEWQIDARATLAAIVAKAGGGE
jgi:hypothetical protein